MVNRGNILFVYKSYLSILKLRLQYVTFCSRIAREGCRDLANERTPKNELINHVSVPLFYRDGCP
jgi:hypothetical protein